MRNKDERKVPWRVVCTVVKEALSGRAAFPQDLDDRGECNSGKSVPGKDNSLSKTVMLEYSSL